MISFSKPYSFYQPVFFPSDNPYIQQSYVIAPFANDLDITVNSSVSVSVFDILKSDATSVERSILQHTSRFIQDSPLSNDPSFNGYWMLVATWHSTKMFPRSAVEEAEEFLSLPNDIQQTLNKVKQAVHNYVHFTILIFCHCRKTHFRLSSSQTTLARTQYLRIAAVMLLLLVFTTSRLLESMQV